MTANQIEYQKLLETKRHNLVTEGYEGEYKKAQTDYTYASIDLIGEQIKTQATQQALNLSGAAANYASATLSYERVNTEQTQQGLNIEKANTEVAQQYGILASADYAAARTTGQEYQNYIMEPDAILGRAMSNSLTNDRHSIDDYFMYYGNMYNRYGSNLVSDVSTIVNNANRNRNDMVSNVVRALK